MRSLKMPFLDTYLKLIPDEPQIHWYTGCRRDNSNSILDIKNICWDSFSLGTLNRQRRGSPRILPEHSAWTPTQVAQVRGCLQIIFVTQNRLCPLRGEGVKGYPFSACWKTDKQIFSIFFHFFIVYREVNWQFSWKLPESDLLLENRKIKNSPGILFHQWH